MHLRYSWQDFICSTVMFFLFWIRGSLNIIFTVKWGNNIILMVMECVLGLIKLGLSNSTNAFQKLCQTLVSYIYYEQLAQIIPSMQWDELCEACIAFMHGKLRTGYQLHGNESRLTWLEYHYYLHYPSWLWWSWLRINVSSFLNNHS